MTTKKRHLSLEDSKKRNNQNKYLSILNKSQQLLMFISPELKIKQLNTIAKKLLGKCINQNITEILKPNVNLKNILSASDSKFSKFTSITKTNKYIKWTVEPIYNNKLLKGFLLLGQDITKQTIAEEKIFNLESILASLPGNVYWMDKNCVHLGCSDNVLTMLGLTREQYIGTTYEKLAILAGWQGQGDSFKSDDLEVIATQKAKKNVEEPLLTHKDGSMHYYLTTRVPLFDKKGKLIGVAGISTDITERKMIEKQLLAAKTEAELANKATRIFAKSLAHELRTPLASINGYTYGIKKYLPTLFHGYQLAKENNLPVTGMRTNHYKSLASIIKKIESEINHANSVVDMTLFRVNHHQLKNTKLKTYKIQNCIKEALINYPFSSYDQKSLINCEINNDFKFKGEKLFTIHVLFNLLKNALYYIEKERKGEIYIWTSSQPAYNTLHFKDTSKGISPDILSKIFDLYFSETPHGTGVGLAFCKQVMQIFSGDIECQSQAGIYTEFILKFPSIKQ